MAATAQTKPLASSQHLNSTPGWLVGDMNRLRRFLCTGTEGATYYIHDKALTQESTEGVSRLIESGHGPAVVDEIITMSVNGRAAKQNPCIFALATCARSTDLKTKQAAYKALSEVCRNATHLFHFVEYAESITDKSTGWGRSQRKAISKWYNDKDPTTLALEVTKYKQRNGWSHIDLLRLAHVKPSSKGNISIWINLCLTYLMQPPIL